MDAQSAPIGCHEILVVEQPGGKLPDNTGEDRECSLAGCTQPHFDWRFCPQKVEDGRG